MYFNYFSPISFLVSMFFIYFFGYCKFIVTEISFRLILKCILVLRIQVGRTNKVSYRIVLYL